MTVSRQNRGGHQPLCFIGLIGLLFVRGCQSSWYQDSLPEGIGLTTQMKRPNESFKVYQSIWFHGDHWYGLRRPSELDVYMEEGITSNNDLVVFPVSDPAAYLSNIDVIWVPGTTLLVDFPFPNLPNHQDHWAEVMLPYFSVLSNGSWASAVTAAAPSYISAVVVLNLDKKMNDWFSSVLREALRPAVRPVGDTAQAGYTVIDRNMLMGDGNARNWIGFENLVVITDRYTHPDRLRGYAGGDHGDMWKSEGCSRYISDTWSPGFLAPTDGQVFRSQAYRRVGLPPPDAWTPGTPPQLPRQITFMFGDEGNTVENRYEVMAMLSQLADEVGWRFRTLSLSTTAPIESYVTAMASTGVLVARSSPLLANAIFLPPGAMVLELLPYNWEWKSISQLHFNLTHSVGDIHHFAWRPHRSQWAAYPSKWEQRYATWTVEECSSRECILVHAKAGMLVDVEAVRSALLSKLDRVVQGAAVSELHEPWPSA